MPHEVALFWAVLVGLLLLDNLALVPSGGDYLRFDRKGLLRYDPRSRLQMLGRDLVVSNPVNPFDRVAFTKRALGPLTGAQLRSAGKLLRSSLPGVNLLSWLGGIYLLGLGVLMAASLKVGFGPALRVLAVAHLLTWSLALSVLAIHRRRMGLTRGHTAALAFEALVVPGYTINLGKRVWRRHRLDMPAMAFGLRGMHRIADPAERELYALQIAQRFEELADELDLGEAERPAEQSAVGIAQGASLQPEPMPVRTQPTLHKWITDARQCLTTSAPPAGS